MKLFKILATVATSGYVLLMLGACGKTSNNSDSSPPAAATPASACTRSADGTMRDQYSRVCSNYANATANCANARLNPSTGSYVDSTTGAPVTCNPSGYFDGYNSVPYNGTYQGNSFQGCQGWTQIYGAQYIPVDIGNGQLVCMNYAYLGSIYPQVNQNPPTYYYSQPVYTCSGYDCSGYSNGNDSGYGSGGRSQCSFQVNLGYFNSNFGASGGICVH